MVRILWGQVYRAFSQLLGLIDIAGLKSKTKRLEGALAGLNEIVRSIDAAAQIASQSHCYGGTFGVSSCF